MTLGEKLQLAGGRSSGFDYMRLGLACSIIFWHGIVICYGGDVEIPLWRAPAGAAMHFALPMFFALSGFLVSGSLNRCRTLISFFGLRALRIVPALAAEVALSALILGPLLTSRDLATYFRDPLVISYALNVIGDVHFALPGVFTANPLAAIVNGQLWTIPFELQCYLALGGLAVAGALRKRGLLLAVVLLCQALWAWEAVRRGDDGGSGGASGPVLVIAFLFGVVLHLYRDSVPWRWSLFWACVLCGATLSILPHGAYYLPLPACYITVFLGLLTPPRLWIVSSGDYSYGLYLYGFPLQQAVASLGPLWQRWWIDIGLALPGAFLAALLSWHFVERPALSLRHGLPAIDAKAASVFCRTGTQALAPLHWGWRLIRRVLAWLVGAMGIAGVLLLVNADGALASAALCASFFAAVLRVTLSPPRLLDHGAQTAT